MNTVGISSNALFGNSANNWSVVGLGIFPDIFLIVYRSYFVSPSKLVLTYRRIFIKMHIIVALWVYCTVCQGLQIADESR